MLPLINPDFSLSVDHLDNNGLVSLSVVVPVDFLESVPPLLNSLSLAFKHARFRSRVLVANQKLIDPVEIEKRKASIAARDAMVLKVYDKFVRSGLTPRQSFMSTKIDLLKRDYQTTCYDIELIARKHGRLSTRRKALK